MIRASLAAAVVLLAGATATADRDERAGTPGHVTAWDADKSVLVVVACPVDRDRLWDYVGCGERARDLAVDRLCDLRGLGEHVWFFQIGASTAVARMTARCRSA